jgi:hypothetical protein
MQIAVIFNDTSSPAPGFAGLAAGDQFTGQNRNQQWRGFGSALLGCGHDPLVVAT